MGKTIDARLQQMEANQTRIGGDVQTLFNHMNDLAVSNAKLETLMSNLMLVAGELKEAVESLKAKPAGRWESLISTLISALAGAAVMYFIGNG